MLRVVVVVAALFAVGAESEPLFGFGWGPWGTSDTSDTSDPPIESTSSGNGSIIETKVWPWSVMVDNVPLTEEDFTRAELIDDRALAESYSDGGDGGPLMSNGTMEVVGIRVR